MHRSLASSTLTWPARAHSSTWAGVNTYGGATMINAGILTTGATNTLRARPSSRWVRGLLDLNNFAKGVGSIVGGGTMIALGSGTLTTGGDNSSDDLPV